MAYVWTEPEILDQVQALSGLVESLIDRISNLESFVEEVAGDVPTPPAPLESCRIDVAGWCICSPSEFVTIQSHFGARGEEAPDPGYCTECGEEFKTCSCALWEEATIDWYPSGYGGLSA